MAPTAKRTIAKKKRVAGNNKMPRAKAQSMPAALSDGWVAAERRIRSAARTLHDHVGSQLAAAGLQWQLLRLDHKELGQAGEDFAQLLIQTGDQIRNLIMELDPSPVGSTGLQTSLLQLAERFRRAFSVAVEVTYRRQTPVSRVVAEEIVWLSALILQTASQAGAESFAVTLTGSRAVTVNIEVMGRPKGAARAFEPVRHLAESAGFIFDRRVVKARLGINTVIKLHHAAG